LLVLFFALPVRSGTFDGVLDDSFLSNSVYIADQLYSTQEKLVHMKYSVFWAVAFSYYLLPVSEAVAQQSVLV
tara:strand:+ start:2149 stop:2367 length:219 start_codon:yes stop_codon:yes gene_type:complete